MSAPTAQLAPAHNRQPPNAAQAIQHALLADIISGDLLPGSRLVDSAVADAHGVSRNTAREALGLLAQSGLAASVRNAGYRVRELGTEDVADIYAARRVVEAGGIDRSVTAANELFSAVEAAAAATETLAAAGDWQAVGTSSLEFHRALVGLASAPSLDRFFANTAARLRLAFAVMPDQAEFQLLWVDRDRRIADLVLGGARAEAIAELERYLDESEARVIDAVRAAARRN